MFEECEVDSYPIDPFFIARKLHYVLRPYSSLPLDDYLRATFVSPDGYSILEKNPDTGLWVPVIYYNDGVSPYRIRWTLLHEIAHCYLGHIDNPDDSQSDIEEAEANLFAKYALAPPPLIHVCQCATPADVARTFCLSADAATYSYDYYLKWVYYGPRCYQDFELQLLRLFHLAA